MYTSLGHLLLFSHRFFFRPMTAFFIGQWGAIGYIDIG
jgi:hypothetical protein